MTTTLRTSATVRMQSIALLFFVLAMAPLAPRVAHAAPPIVLTATPVIIDEKVKPQDILNESITITNTSDHKLSLYPSVSDISTTTGEQAFQYAFTGPQAAGSLSNWIELSRGVIDLNAGEEKTVPFVIQVPRDTPVGSYHALISFASGSTRDQAVAAGSLAEVTVNAELQADIKEIMQLKSFSTDNVVFTGDDALFKYQLQNIGNQPLDPKGEIRIYDRQGEEVASVNVNNEGKVVSPDQVSQLASAWNSVNGFGKYKAVIDVDYGTVQPASAQDITYFWVIPWKQVLIASIVSLIGLILLAVYFEQWFRDWHLSKFAAAGLLKNEVAAEFAPPKFVSPAAPMRPDRTPQPSTAPPTGGNVAPTGFFGVSRGKDKIVPELKQKSPVAGSLRDRLQIEPRTAAASPTAKATIDLKQMMQTTPNKKASEQHVINLKR